MVDRPLVPAPYVSPAEFRVQQRPRQEREADQEERVIRRVDAPENVIRGRHVQQAQIHAEVREGGLCPGPAEKQQQSGEERGLAENARREPPHASLVQRANLATAVRRHVFRNGAGARAGHRYGVACNSSASGKSGVGLGVGAGDSLGIPVSSGSGLSVITGLGVVTGSPPVAGADSTARGSPEFVPTPPEFVPSPHAKNPTASATQATVPRHRMAKRRYARRRETTTLPGTRRACKRQRCRLADSRGTAERGLRAQAR